MKDIIYAVFAKGLDRDALVGYATGEWEDIESYYHEQQNYGLYIKEVKPVNVPRGHRIAMGELMKEKNRVQEELCKIERKIRESGG